LRRELWGTLFTRGYLGKCLLMFTTDMIQVSLLLLELATNFDVIHMMLVVQTCRIQEFQGHIDFHLDFKGQPGRPDSV
jgi:hypothetical protein